MEIDRHIKLVPVATVEPTSAARGNAVNRPVQPKAQRAPAGELPLEQMQQALRALPEVDMEKVQAIKLALQRGEIPLDVAQLAHSILAYHRGSDV